MEARESTATSTPCSKVKASVVVPCAYLMAGWEGWWCTEVSSPEGTGEVRREVGRVKWVGPSEADVGSAVREAPDSSPSA